LIIRKNFNVILESNFAGQTLPRIDCMKVTKEDFFPLVLLYKLVLWSAGVLAYWRELKLKGGGYGAKSFGHIPERIWERGCEL